MTDVSRRALLGLAAAALATPAGAQSPAAFGNIVVDVAELRARGLGAYADFVQAALLAEARRLFADRLGGGPALVIRITGISLNSYAGSGVGGRSSGGRGGAGDNDYLEGEALIVGPGRQILARHPQLSALPASTGGSPYDPLSEQKRTAALAYHFAWWLRRTLA